MNNKVYTAVGLLAVFLVAAGAAVASSVDSQSHEMSANASVVEDEDGNITAGIAAGEKMDFGKTGEQVNTTKTVSLEHGQLTLVRPEVEGNISQGLIFEDSMLFEGDESMDFTFAGEPGNYTGTINLEMRTAENIVGEKWLELLHWLH